MSSISVSLTSEADVEVFGVRWRPLVVAKTALKNMMEGLTGYIDSMIGFVISIPVLILWVLTYGLGLLVIWKVGKWLKRRYWDKNNEKNIE